MKDRYGLLHIKKDRTGKADMQESGMKASGKTNMHESRKSGKKRTVKSAGKSPKASRTQRMIKRLLRGRWLTAACLMLCAAVLCVVCIPAVKRFSYCFCASVRVSCSGWMKSYSIAYA